VLCDKFTDESNGGKILKIGKQLSKWHVFYGPLCIILSAAMPTSGLNDRISTEWQGEQYLLGAT